MKFTDRDIEILKFINEFGFCEICQIQKQFGLRKARSYQIMERLIKADLVKHERIFFGRNGVYSLTKAGADCTDLPPLSNIPKDNYNHQLTVIDVYFNIKEKYPESSWLGERRIKRDKSVYGVGRKVKHLADAVVVLPDNKQIAIEVELTMKSLKRLNEIINSYVMHNEIAEAWYFCSEETIEKVRKIAGNCQNIKIHGLN